MGIGRASVTRHRHPSPHIRLNICGLRDCDGYDGLYLRTRTIVLRRDALLAREELAERGGVGKVQLCGYLGDAERRGAQQVGGLHQQVLVDVVDDGTARDLTDDAREIDRRDVEGGGIEGDVVMFGKVLRQQADEADEDVLDALWYAPLADGLGLRTLHVEQEDGIEHLQNLALVDVVGVKIADDLVHLVLQPAGVVVRQRNLRLVQVDDGHVGYVDEVVNGWRLDGQVLVGQQADGAIVLGGCQYGHFESWRIDVEVVGLQGELLAVVDNREPALGNEGEAVGRHEPLRLVGTEGEGCIRLLTVHPAVPLLEGQLTNHHDPCFT